VGGLHPIVDLVADAVAALRSQYGHEVVALFLAGVLIWSGAAKLRRPRLAALAIADFGLVRHPRRGYGIVLGLAELGLAASLAPQPRMPLVLGAVSFALLAFTAVVARALWRSDRFACFCFGGEEELSRTSLLRNLALLGLLAFLWTPIAGGPVSAPPGTWTLMILIALGGLATAALLARVPRLLRWNREVREHLESRAREVVT